MIALAPSENPDQMAFERVEMTGAARNLPMPYIGEPGNVLETQSTAWRISSVVHAYEKNYREAKEIQLSTKGSTDVV